MTGARRATVMSMATLIIDVMRQQVKGEWTVHHQLGHVEKRKKHWWKDPWTLAEWGNYSGSLMVLLDARERWQRRRRKSGCGVG
jgi:hypothetical protein